MTDFKILKTGPDTAEILDIYCDPETDSLLIIPSNIDGRRITKVSISIATSKMLSFCPPFDVVIEEGIESLANGIFADTCIHSLTLPSTLSVIPSCCCQGCYLLESVCIPEEANLEIIEPRAFISCTKLKSFSFVKSIKEIREKAFAGCSFENLSFPKHSKLEIIEEAAFSKNTSLKQVNLKYTELDRFENMVFKECQSLSKVTFPEDLVLIGEESFMSCDLSKTSLCGLTCITDIKDRAFKDTHIKDGRLPDSLEEIGDESFANTDIEELKINNNLKVIGSSAFANSNISSIGNISNLTNVVIYSLAFTECKFEHLYLPCLKVSAFGPEYQYGIFSYNKQLKSVSMAEGNRVVFPRMFFKCNLLKEISLPYTIRAIKSYAFTNCSLKFFTGPSSLRKIAEGAFNGCPLKEVDLSFSIKSLTIDSEVFNSKAKYILPTGGYTLTFNKDTFPSEVLSEIERKYPFAEILE